MARNPEMGGGRARSGSMERGVQGTGERRPRTEPRGFLGDERNDDERDPTRTTGIGFLDAADAFLQQPQTPQDVTTPTERPGNRELADRPRQPLRSVRPPEEEEPPILPGNPNDLGARGRRRRRQDDDTPSPVLRRGLLGV